jgi:hypothetical protein
MRFSSSSSSTIAAAALWMVGPLCLLLLSLLFLLPADIM